MKISEFRNETQYRRKQYLMIDFKYINFFFCRLYDDIFVEEEFEVMKLRGFDSKFNI